MAHFSIDTQHNFSLDSLYLHMPLAAAAAVAIVYTSTSRFKCYDVYDGPFWCNEYSVRRAPSSPSAQAFLFHYSLIHSSTQ